MFETIHTVVFEEKAGGGNPCPVTLNADELTAEEMQAMTKEFGEESAFLMRPTRPGCDVKARYFVPLHEMEMCIHATIGSATVLIEKGLFTTSPIIYETFYGPVRIDWERKNGSIEVSVAQFLPKYQEVNPSKEEICKALRIRPEDIADHPIQSVATSRFKLIIPLMSKRTVYSLQPDFEYLWALCDKYETTGFYPYAQDLEHGQPVFFARQFPRRAGYPEDPATGVAASALSAYLTNYKILPIVEGWNSFTIKQGEAMGKPSVIVPACFVANGEITRTRVSGNAHRI